MPIQYWTPDTCGCTFAQRHGEGNGVQFEAIERKCPVHESVSDVDLYDLVRWGEVQRKNDLHKALLETTALGLSELRRGRADLGENPRDIVLAFKEDVEWAWSFEGEGSTRTLKTSVTGPNIDDKRLGDIKAAIEQAVGSEKLAIVDDVAVPLDEIEIP